MAVHQRHEILSAQSVDHDMDDGECREILFFLKIQDSLLQCVGDTAADLVPELAACVRHILDLREQNLVELADLQLDNVEALRLKGDQFHPVARDMENGLRLRPVLRRQYRVELVGKRDRFQFQIDRIQVGRQKGVRPLAQACVLGVSDHDTGQVVILRADKRVVGDERVFELAVIGLKFDPEGGILGFLGKLGRCHEGQVQLPDLDDAARNDQAGVLGRETDLVAQAAEHVSDHVLLAGQILDIQLARKGHAGKLADIYHIGFMANFGYREGLVVKFHSHNLVGAFSDRP